MTIRECLGRLRKVSSNRVYTRNGSFILVENDWDPNWCMSSIKMIDGKPVKRYIYFSIPSSEKMEHMEVIDRYRIDFGCNAYIAKERDLNLFLSLNGGIDEYMSCSVPEFMRADAMYILNDATELFNTWENN